MGSVIAIKKRDRALLVKLFTRMVTIATLHCGNIADTNTYEVVGPMSRNALMNIVSKFEKTVDLGVSPGRGLRLILIVVGDEVVVAVTITI